MKYFRFLVACFFLTPFALLMAADVVPLTPAEAAKKVDEKVVVEFEVLSSGGRNNQYLNSEEDYKNAKNFTIFISKDHLPNFKKGGIENPAVHYKGKFIQVTGTVELHEKKPQIKVEQPDQVKIIVKKNK